MSASAYETAAQRYSDRGHGASTVNEQFQAVVAGSDTYPTLRTQLGIRYSMAVGAENVGFNLISPPPDSLRSRTPIVLAVGEAETPELLEPLLAPLYEAGRIIVTAPQLAPRGQAHKVAVVESLIDQALAFDPGLPRDKELVETGQVDMIGRSDGGVNVVLAASASPDEVRTVYLLDTKFTDPSNLAAASVEFGRHAIAAATDAILHPWSISARATRVLLRQAMAYGSSPLDLLSELDEHVRSDVKPMLPDLREAGVTVIGIQRIDDDIFPMMDAQRAIARAPITLFDGFFSIGNGKQKQVGHSAIYNQSTGYGAGVGRIVELVSSLADQRAASEQQPLARRNGLRVV